MKFFKFFINVIVFICIAFPILAFCTLVGAVFQLATYGFTTGQYHVDIFMKRDWLQEYLPKEG